MLVQSPIYIHEEVAIHVPAWKLPTTNVFTFTFWSAKIDNKPIIPSTIGISHTLLAAD